MFNYNIFIKYSYFPIIYFVFPIIIYKLNLFKKKPDINKYDKHLISKYIFICFIQQR